MPDGTQEKNGPFDGCNGLYFWEMFFHTPDLVGTRLTAEGRYREAQGWYEYIFHPLAREVPESSAEDDSGKLPPLPIGAAARCGMTLIRRTKPRRQPTRTPLVIPRPSTCASPCSCVTWRT